MKISKNCESEEEDDMLPEYELDFSKSKKNRFAEVLKRQGNFIELEPDIQKVFKNSEEVNNALRAFINAIPKHSINWMQNL